MIKHDYLLRLTKNIILTLEDDQIPFVNYLFTFILVIGLRNLVESFSQSSFNYLDYTNNWLAVTFIHTTLSYVAIAFQIILLFYYATREPLIKIAKVVLPSFILLLATPCIDLLITSGKGHDLAYFLPPMSLTDLIKNYLTYCSYYSLATPGVRVEVFIFLTGIYCYLRVKNKSVLSSLLYTVLGYTLIFLWSCSPILIKPILTVLGFDYSFSAPLMLNYFALLLAFLGIWLLFLILKSRLVVILKNSALNYIACSLALLFGLAWSFSSEHAKLTEQLHQYPDAIISVMFSLISLLFATGFIAILKETYPDRSSTTELRQASHANDIHLWIGYVALTLAGLYAALAGTKAFAIILFAVGCDYLRYAPPLRLGRSAFFMALSSNSKLLALFLLGHLFLKNQFLFQQDFFFGLTGTLLLSSIVPYYDILFKKNLTARFSKKQS